MAVVSAPPSSGLMLVALLITVWACMVFTIISRPVQLDAVGSVSVTVPARLHISQLVVSATVCVASVTVTGALRDKEPLTCNVAPGDVVPPMYIFPAGM